MSGDDGEKWEGEKEEKLFHAVPLKKSGPAVTSASPICPQEEGEFM
jgi:hypothetical protein